MPCPAALAPGWSRAETVTRWRGGAAASRPGKGSPKRSSGPRWPKRPGNFPRPAREEGRNRYGFPRACRRAGFRAGTVRKIDAHRNPAPGSAAGPRPRAVREKAILQPRQAASSGGGDRGRLRGPAAEGCLATASIRWSDASGTAMSSGRARTRPQLAFPQRHAVGIWARRMGRRMFRPGCERPAVGIAGRPAHRFGLFPTQLRLSVLTNSAFLKSCPVLKHVLSPSFQLPETRPIRGEAIVSPSVPLVLAVRDTNSLRIRELFPYRGISSVQRAPKCRAHHSGHSLTWR